MNDPRQRHPTGARVRPRTRALVVISPPTLSAHFVDGLQADGDISVVGQATAAGVAAAQVAALRPDVVLLDLDAPGGSAHQAIQEIMDSNPTPILVVCPANASGGTLAELDALAAGAVDSVAKPNAWTPAFEAELRRQVRILRGVTVLRHRSASPRPTASGASPVAPSRTGEKAGRVVGIAASTGGPAALAEIVGQLAGIRAAVLIVQHMHVDFVDGLVAWMQRASCQPVRQAVHGERLDPGVVYIGPGDVHLKVGPGCRIVLDPEPVTTHRPSADELFRSMAEHLGPAGIGVVLTGMGDDGAAGLLALRQSGGITMGQDAATSVVYGMPRAAQLAGAVGHVLPLDEIAAALVAASRGVRL